MQFDGRYRQGRHTLRRAPHRQRKSSLPLAGYQSASGGNLRTPTLSRRWANLAPSGSIHLMPLMKSLTDKAFRSNVREMVEAGHPVKQALAAAYRTKRAAAKKPNRGASR